MATNCVMSSSEMSELINMIFIHAYDSEMWNGNIIELFKDIEAMNTNTEKIAIVRSMVDLYKGDNSLDDRAIAGYVYCCSRRWTFLRRIRNRCLAGYCGTV
jgi:tRNA(Glu) U13 pseudouridine synthase TruD